MKRILLSGAILIAVGAFLVLSTAASNSGNANGTYKIELDNAFGLTSGADFKVAGVRAGTIENIDLPQGCINGDVEKCHALITVQVSQPGLGSFHSDAFCQSRPQSLIGEYFVECEPGTKGKVLAPGSTIPVSRTQSTIPADLLANIMRMPYRERLTLIINELGAAVAGRSGDLAAALRRAVPALTETDNLLNLLANDSNNIEQLTANSDSVVTALANNTTTVERFIDEANRIAIHTANQQTALRGSLQQLPTFLEQLRPSLRQLGATTDANLPVLVNLGNDANQLDRFLTDLPGFSRSARPAIKTLGQASVTGKVAVQAAQPTIAHLNQFAKPAPELAQNLAIVGHDLDDRSRAVETDPRSPHGQGYTGLEAAAPVRVQPDARDQYVRALRSPARGRRVRERDVHAVRDAGHDRPEPEELRLGVPQLLFVARAQPGRRHDDRPLEPERLRAGSGRCPAGPDRPAGNRLQVESRGCRARRDGRRQAGAQHDPGGQRDGPAGGAINRRVDPGRRRDERRRDERRRDDERAGWRYDLARAGLRAAADARADPRCPWWRRAVVGRRLERDRDRWRVDSRIVRVRVAGLGPGRPGRAGPATRPSSSSTTCLPHETRASQRIHQSRARRRGHRADDHGRRLPGLQRQPGAAVRADAGAQGRRLGRLEPRDRQRRPRGRVPDRARLGHEADRASQRAGGRGAHAPSRQVERLDPGRLKGLGRAPVAPRSEVRRDREGDLEDDHRRRRHAAALAHDDPGSARRRLQRVRREDPAGDRERPARVRQHPHRSRVRL